MFSRKELKIEQAVLFGSNSYAVINGEIFREGSVLLDGIIEKIIDGEITISINGKLIVKDVGTKIKYNSTLVDVKSVHKIEN